MAQVAIAAIGLGGKLLASAVPAAGIFGIPAIVAQAGVGFLAAGLQFGAQQLLQGDSNAGALSRTVSSVPKLGERFAVLGEVITGGHVIHRDPGDNGDLFHVVAVSYAQVDSFVEHLIDGEVVTLDGSGWVQTPTKWRDLVQILTRFGTPGQASVNTLVNNLGYLDANFRGRGIAYAVVRQRPVASSRFNETYPNTSVAYSARIRGADLPHPNAATAYSTNGARAVLWHLTDAEFGYGTPLADIDLASFQIHLQLCDELVPLRAGGTERRYATHGYVDGARRKLDVLRDLLTNCDADLILNSQGQLAIVPLYQPSAYSLTDDVVTLINLQRGAAEEERVNSVVTVYADADRSYNETTTPPRDLALVEGESRNVVSTTLPFCTSGAQAQRLSKRMLYRSNPTATGTVEGNIAALPVRPGEFFTLDTTGGLVDDALRVTARSVTLPSETTPPALSFSVSAFDPEIDLWDAQADEIEIADPVAVNGSGTILAPPVITGTLTETQLLNGAIGSVIRVNFTAGSADTYAEIEWSISGQDDFEGPVRRGAGGGTIRTAILAESEDYDVRVRFVLRDGTGATDWTEATGISVVADSTATTAPTISATPGSSPGQISVTVTAPGDPNYFRCEIRSAAVTGSETFPAADFERFTLINQAGGSTTFTISVLPGQNTKVWAEAQNGSGVGDSGSRANGTALAPDNDPP